MPVLVIGRAALGGGAVNQDFVTGAHNAAGVAVDAAHLYWVNNDDGTIGRADLDGTGADQDFIAGAHGPVGVAVDAGHVYWANAGTSTIGRANLDGSGVNQSFITVAGAPAGVAVDALGQTPTPPGGDGTPVPGGTPGPAPGPASIPDVTAPVLTGLAVRPTRFAAAPKGASLIARVQVGATVRYSLSESAIVTFKVKLPRAGRLVKGTCRRPTRKTRRSKRCDLRLAGSFSHAGKQGANRFRFTGRLNGRRLGPRAYRLEVTATDAAGNTSKPVRAGFRIARRPAR